MNVHVKTIEEVRTNRVVLQLEGDPDEVAEAIDRITANRLYTADEVADAQYSEAELIAKSLRVDLDKVKTELTDTQSALCQAKELADQEHEWAERAEKRATDKAAQLDEANLAVQLLSAQIGKIGRTVTGHEIREALNEAYDLQSKSSLMQDRIRKTREILGIRTHEGQVKTSQA
jgi:hypothetical protein